MNISKENTSILTISDIEEASLLQKESGSAIDYKKFWKFINQLFFSKDLSKNLGYLSLLITKLSEYGK